MILDMDALRLHADRVAELRILRKHTVLRVSAKVWAHISKCILHITLVTSVCLKLGWGSNCPQFQSTEQTAERRVAAERQAVKGRPCPPTPYSVKAKRKTEVKTTEGRRKEKKLSKGVRFSSC